MPEPIQSRGTNQCQLEAPEPLVCEQPPASPTSADRSHEPPPLDPAVSQLVQAHSRRPAIAPNCGAEAVALASAGIKASLSLAGVAVAAPTELALPLAIGKFLVDAIALGSAAADFENCKDGRSRSR